VSGDLERPGAEAEEELRVHGLMAYGSTANRSRWQCLLRTVRGGSSC